MKQKDYSISNYWFKGEVTNFNYLNSQVTLRLTLARAVKSIPKIALLISLILFFGCAVANPKSNQEEILESIDVLLVKALDMRCNYHYSVDETKLKVECVNEKNDTCRKTAENIDKNYYLDLANELKKTEPKVYELEKVNEGQVLKIIINWKNKKSQSYTVINFSDRNINLLDQINPKLKPFYKQLELFRCW